MTAGERFIERLVVRGRAAVRWLPLLAAAAAALGVMWAILVAAIVVSGFLRIFGLGLAP